MSEPVLFTDDQTGRQLLLADRSSLSKRSVVVSDPDTGDAYMVPTKDFLAHHSEGSKRRRFRRRKGGGR